jgi:hypothetical protein
LPSPSAGRAEPSSGGDHDDVRVECWYWFDAMQWLRVNTPEPFATPDAYYARYEKTNPPRPSA